MERLKKVLVDSKITLKQALRKMDDSAEKILFVVDNHNRLLGTVTDGDIRRWILKGRSLKARITGAMNKNPVFLKNEYTLQEAKKIMLARKIECIPIVDTNQRIISAIWWLDLFNGETKKIKRIDVPVVIMAGGQGMRLSPFTRILPKPLIPIGEKPIIELIMEKFIHYGCRQFYLLLNYKANIIKAYFSESLLQDDNLRGININYVEETHPLGTAGGLSLLKEIKTSFFVSNCDILVEADYADILDFHRKNKNKITMAVCMKHYTIPYGICEIFNNGALKRVKEKPEYDFLVNTGLYVLEPQILKSIPANKVYHMTDLVNDTLKKRKKIGVYPISEKSWLDMGQWEELHQMLKKFGAK